MGLRFLNSCFCWMTVTMVYYGLSLNATNLAGNPYTNFILVSLVEIPGKYLDTTYAIQILELVLIFLLLLLQTSFYSNAKVRVVRLRFYVSHFLYILFCKPALVLPYVSLMCLIRHNVTKIYERWKL